MTALSLAELLYRSRLSFQDEKQLQDDITAVLERAGIKSEAEVSLTPKDRIDFLCGDTGIEVKVGSSPSMVQRQLWRYAQSPQIASLILVTTRSSHKELGGEMLGKPVHVVHLINSFF
jgi:hypothetical protein